MADVAVEVVDLRSKEEIDHQQMIDMVYREVGEHKIGLRINKFCLKEDIKEQHSNLLYDLEFVQLDMNNSKNISIEGSGRGIVDALFTSLVKYYSEEYPSLKGIRFEKFILTADLESKTGKKRSSGAEVSGFLTIYNSEYKEYTFQKKAFSMNAAAIGVVREMVEFFINAEIVTLKLTACIRDAKKRNRQDLIDKYTFLLAELVKITCYEEAIKKQKETK